MESFNLKKRIASFSYAINGVKTAIKTQWNMKIHIFAASFAILMGFLLKISQTEWLVLIIIISMVIITELINTSIELLTDLVSPEQNPIAGKVKDIAAGAVLITAITAIIIGIIIFAPRITNLI